MRGKRGKPLVSVVIPTFNSWGTLQVTLTYLGRQFFPLQDLEVIVVDDGSTDGTGEALKEKEFPFTFSYVRQRNKKQGAARNRGAADARGTYLLFLDSDVIPSRRLVAAHVEMHERYPNSIVQGETLPAPGTCLIDALNMEETFQDRGYLHGQVLEFETITCNLSLKREAFLAVGGFDESFDCYGYEDVEIGFRLVTERRLALRYSKEALAHHYNRLTFQARARKQWENGRSFIRLLRLHPDILHLKHSTEFAARSGDLLRACADFSPFSMEEIDHLRREVRRREAAADADPSPDNIASLSELYKRLFTYCLKEGAFNAIHSLGKNGSVFASDTCSASDTHVRIPVEWHLDGKEVSRVAPLVKSLARHGIQTMLLPDGGEPPTAKSDPDAGGQSVHPVFSIWQGSAFPEGEPEPDQYHIVFHPVDDMSRGGRSDRLTGPDFLKFDEVWIFPQAENGKSRRTHGEVRETMIPPWLDPATCHGSLLPGPIAIPGRTVLVSVVPVPVSAAALALVEAYREEFKPGEGVFLMLLQDRLDPGNVEESWPGLAALRQALDRKRCAPVMIWRNPPAPRDLFRSAAVFLYMERTSSSPTHLLSAVASGAPVIAGLKCPLFGILSRDEVVTAESCAIDHLRAVMRGVVARLEEHRARGRRLQDRVLAEFSVDAAAKRIASRLQEIFDGEMHLRRKIFTNGHPVGVSTEAEAPMRYGEK